MKAAHVVLGVFSSENSWQYVTSTLSATLCKPCVQRRKKKYGGGDRGGHCPARGSAPGELWKWLQLISHSRGLLCCIDLATTQCLRTIKNSVRNISHSGQGFGNLKAQTRFIKYTLHPTTMSLSSYKPVSFNNCTNFQTKFISILDEKSKVLWMKTTQKSHINSLNNKSS